MAQHDSDPRRASEPHAYPALVTHALASHHVYGMRFVASDYCRAPKAERDAVDAWLVATRHPLGMEPGTQQSRFLALVREALATEAEAVADAQDWES
jgi:hypothetical protein